MRIALVLLATVLIPWLASAQDESKWKVFAPKDAGLAVKFPGDPVVKSGMHEGETVYLAGIQRKAIDDLGYVVQWTTKEKAFADKMVEGEFVRNFQKGAVLSTKGKLVEEKEVSLDGLVGRQFIIELPDKNVLHSRVYVAGKRVVNLQAWGKDKEAVCSKDAMRFFESLTISK
jgi:hypothetical protein